jgi:hypothetical protein
MEKLTEQHLKGYLGTGLKVRTKIIGRHSATKIQELDGSLIDSFKKGIYTIFRPYLLPLSSLTKEITQNGETFVPWQRLFKNTSEPIIREYIAGENQLTICVTYKLQGEVFTEFIVNRNEFYEVNYHVVESLFEWHFDVHGLIENNLAIDASTLKDNPY